MHTFSRLALILALFGPAVAVAILESENTNDKP